MHLEGSCHCGAVSFSLESSHPSPFNYCYCSICRKTNGGGGFAINIGGEFDSLKVIGGDHVKAYRAVLKNAETGEDTLSQCERNFCSNCGSGLWVWDPRWPELVHPFASVIDTELPIPPERTHLMLGSKAGWIPVHAGPSDQQFDEYPSESIAEWHQRLGEVR
jgi:hypothetical protein